MMWCGKEATAHDCWDSEEWSAKHGETADDRESMRMAEFGYYTSGSETDDEPLPYEPDCKSLHMIHPAHEPVLLSLQHLLIIIACFSGSVSANLQHVTANFQRPYFSLPFSQPIL